MTDETAAPVADAHTGGPLLQATWAGTVVFVVTAVVEAIFLGGTRVVGVIVALVLFAIGCFAFLTAYALAIGRSRTDEIGVANLYFLSGGTAPKAVSLQMNAALAVQIVVAVATASARPFTTLAFGILVPMYGLGLNGVWGARYGRFGRRLPDPPRPPRRKDRTTDDTDADTAAADSTGFVADADDGDSAAAGAGLAVAAADDNFGGTAHEGAAAEQDAEPRRAKRPRTDRAPTDPARTDPARTGRARTDPGRADPGRTGRAPTDPGRTGRVPNDRGRIEPTEAQAEAGTDGTETAETVAETTAAEPTKTAPRRRRG